MTAFAAFVGEEDTGTLVMVDDSRLLRIRIMSRSTPWTAEDLCSRFWPYLWSDQHSPDWIYEKGGAEERLDGWRANVLSEHSLSASPAVTSAVTSISDAMRSNQEVFNGYGQHTAQDLLHTLGGLWPGMPPYAPCLNDATYLPFKQRLHEYARQYQSPPFRYRCLGVPLAYSFKSDDSYHTQYLRVYRKSIVREPYAYTDSELISVKYRDVPVHRYTYSGQDPVYSVITARPPSHWKYSGGDVTQASGLGYDAHPV
ncbi:hypothetical protein BN946_scf184942.g19 [Trametes cinnabarina]|uniref:Uncharacterized protein n=1 Tax=Pycnoporus cinnabarinus TaxID=5643 RepID=A0A060SD56_PYCCI|nr:hypothetical protein BN946_scf184942.g19 [Trametes cinnabarina]